jgi:hypothetical protein
MRQHRKHQLSKFELNLVIITALLLNLFSTLFILCLLQKHLIIPHIEIDLHQTLSLRQILIRLLF